MNHLKYCSYDKLSIWYDTQNRSFKVLYKSSEIINAVIKGIYRDGQAVAAPSDFAECISEYNRSGLINEAVFKITYKGNNDEAISLCFTVTDNKISLTSLNAEFEIRGVVSMPDKNDSDVFPVCLNRCAKDLRSAIGKGATCADNALYSRKTDMAVVIGESGKTRLAHTDDRYEFSLRVTDYDTDIYVKENVLADKYNIVFNPINKKILLKYVVSKNYIYLSRVTILF